MRRLLLLCARQKRLLLFALLAAPLTALAGPASAVTIDWVTVGDPGNAADTPSNCAAANCGSVADPYLISKYEVTNAQYAEFLNLKAAADPLSLYSTNMGSNALGGITRSGISGSYTYAVTSGFADKPVNFVSFYDSLRFTNWLNNGQGSADTETGAYTITALGITNNTITRNLGANIFLTSENEWYKAAYFDGTTYFDYPTGTNSVTSCVAPGSDTGNSANCWPATSPNGALTDVGAYALSDSPYGTFDQGGNVWEWNEELFPEVIVGSEVIAASARGVRGGSLFYGASSLAAGPFSAGAGDPATESEHVGFRVASVPEPGTGLLVVTGFLGLVVRRRLSP